MGDVLSELWRIFKDNIGLLLGAVVVTAVVSNVTDKFLENAEVPLVGNLGIAGILLYLGLAFGSLVLDIFLNLGLTIIALNIVTGRPASFGQLFAGGPFLFRSVVATIIFLLLFLCGFVLLIVPAIIVLLMFGFFDYLIVDQNAGIIDSLTLSKTITTGNKVALFVLGLAAIGIILLGLLACLIGVIFSAAYLQIVAAVAYRKMAGLPIVLDRRSFTGPVA